MPRINIEEKWWGDPRRTALAIKLGDGVADGFALLAWKLAQQYWLPNKELIPLKTWAGCQIPESLIDVGLAEKRGDWVYVSGTEEHFAWWFLGEEKYRDLADRRKEFGRLGGRVSAQRDRDEHGRLLSKSPSKHQASSKQNDGACELNLDRANDDYAHQRGKSPSNEPSKHQANTKQTQRSSSSSSFPPLPTGESPQGVEAPPSGWDPNSLDELKSSTHVFKTTAEVFKVFRRVRETRDLLTPPFTPADVAAARVLVGQPAGKMFWWLMGYIRISGSHYQARGWPLEYFPEAQAQAKFDGERLCWIEAHA